MQNQFIYRKSFLGKMIYGGVFINAEEIACDGSQPELLISSQDNKFEHAVRFGAEYFFRQYTTIKCSSIYIEVLRVYDMLGDTPYIIVSYATIMSLCAIFSFEIEGLSVSDDGKILNIPM